MLLLLLFHTLSCSFALFPFVQYALHHIIITVDNLFQYNTLDSILISSHFEYVQILLHVCVCVCTWFEQIIWVERWFWFGDDANDEKREIMEKKSNKTNWMLWCSMAISWTNITRNVLTMAFSICVSHRGKKGRIDWKWHTHRHSDCVNEMGRYKWCMGEWKREGTMNFPLFRSRLFLTQCMLFTCYGTKTGSFFMQVIVYFHFLFLFLLLFYFTHSARFVATIFNFNVVCDLTAL